LRGIEVIAPDVLQNPKISRTVLYLHGGGHFFGSVWTHREFLGRASSAWEARIVAIDYGLAPHNPFPAGLLDSLAAWSWLSEKYPDDEIAVAGDSAGGNLALALLVRLAQMGRPQPVACIALSPWLDLKADKCKVIVDAYLQGHSSDDPEVSPVLTPPEIVKHFPPVIIHADKDEPLHRQAEKMAALCKSAGIQTELSLFSDTAHAFQCLPWAYKEQSKKSMDQIRTFLDTHIYVIRAQSDREFTPTDQQTVDCLLKASL
jgi:acetyl esterase/lipase